MRHPDTELCLAAMRLAQDHSRPFLFNHVMRTFAFGRAAGAAQGARCDEETLFAGSMLHDLELVEPFIREDRFEIDGADAAADFLSRRGYSDRKIAIIWDASCAVRKGPALQRASPERYGKRRDVARIGTYPEIGIGVRVPHDAGRIDHIGRGYRKKPPRRSVDRAQIEAGREIAVPHLVLDVKRQPGRERGAVIDVTQHDGSLADELPEGDRTIADFPRHDDQRDAGLVQCGQHLRPIRQFVRAVRAPKPALETQDDRSVRPQGTERLITACRIG
nr:hypothetical protein [Sphingomonas montana]